MNCVENARVKQCIMYNSLVSSMRIYTENRGVAHFLSNFCEVVTGSGSVFLFSQLDVLHCNISKVSFSWCFSLLSLLNFVLHKLHVTCNGQLHLRIQESNYLVLE